MGRARLAAALVRAGMRCARQAGLAIDRFRSLRPWFSGTANDIKAKLASYDDLPTPLRDVTNVHTFGEALDVLIEGVPDLTASFLLYVMSAYEWSADKAAANLPGMIRLGSLGIYVSFERYAASIEMFTMHGSKRVVEFEARFMQDEDRADSGFYGTAWPDRTVRITIGFYTLLTVWQALNPDEPLPGFPARSASAASETSE